MANYAAATVTIAELSIAEAVRRALQQLGGIQRFVRAGDFVLIKVNMVREAEPESGLITHPAVVTEVARLCHEQGGRPVVVERTPGLEQNFARYAEIFRYAEVVCLDQARHTARPVPGATILRDEVDWADILDEADVFINIPSLRTHVATGLSNAMQNLVGLLPRISPRRAHAYGLAGSIVDLNVARPSDLVITDAIYAVGDLYPCRQRAYHPGVIMAATNAVVADLLAAKFLGIDPVQTGYLSMAATRGLGPASLDGVELLGEDVDEIARHWPAMAPTTADLEAVAGRFGLGQPEGCLACWRTLVGGLMAVEEDAPHLLDGLAFRCGSGTVGEIGVRMVSFGSCAGAKAALHIPGCPPRAEALREALDMLQPRHPRLAVCSIAWRDDELAQIIPLVAGIGYEGIELWGPHIERYAEGHSVDDLRRVLDVAGLQVPMISPAFNFATDMDAALAAVPRYIEYAERLNAPLIRVFTSGGASAYAKHAVWDRVVEALKRACAWGAERGIAFALETHQNNLHDTTESTLRLIRQVGAENLVVNLDIYNLFDMGEDPLLALRRLLPHTRIMHVKNARHVDGQRSYVPLAAGSMVYAPFLAEVCASNYGGYVSVEWFGADQARAVAAELAYLRTQFQPGNRENGNGA